MRAIALGIVLVGIYTSPLKAQDAEADWALCNASIENHQAGIIGCTRIIETSSQTAKQKSIAFSRRGMVYYSSSEIKRALADLGEAIRLFDPGSPNWRYWRAKISLEQVNNPRLAVEDMNAALALRPNTPEYISLRDQAYKKMAAAGDGSAQVAQIGPSGNRPSFDCTKATSASARLICSDAELSKADGALGKAFQNALRNLEGDNKKAKIQEQVTWLRERNRRCKLDNKLATPVEELVEAKPCMLSWINIRITEIDRNISTNDINALSQKVFTSWRVPVTQGVGLDEFTVDVQIKLKPDGTLAAPVEVLKPKDTTLCFSSSECCRRDYEQPTFLNVETGELRLLERYDFHLQPDASARFKRTHANSDCSRSTRYIAIQ